jgi:hypothetical protein
MAFMPAAVEWLTPFIIVSGFQWLRRLNVSGFQWLRRL